MVRCNKCQIDKEVDQYATYFHSTQNKLRTRKICKICFNLQKKQYRETIIKEKIIQQDPLYVYSRPILTPTPEPLVNPEVFIDMDVDTKQCFTCKVDKPITDFYIHKRTGRGFTSCKICELEKDGKKYEQYIQDNGGSDRVRLRPGQWVDEYQRENVEGFLKVLGWKHNGNHWYKEGVRSGEDGVWERMRGNTKYRKPMTKQLTPITDMLRTKIEDIIKLREAGETLATVAGIYNTSVPTLYKVINEYYEAQKDS